MGANPRKSIFFVRLTFFLLLGLLSTFFAEVLSGSAPDFLLTGFGYYGIFPIYALHSILLSSLLISRRKPFTLRTLYFVSLLFGMYEAYITKVLWSPPWSPNALSFAGLAVAETLILVLFWHAVMAFIIPLLWAEALLTDSHLVSGLFPEKWQKRLFSTGGAIGLGIFGSFFIGSEILPAGDAFMLALFDCLAVTLALGLWRLFMRNESSLLPDLLPRKAGTLVFGALIVLDYRYIGLFLRREVHPGWIGHTAILVLYALISLAIWLSMRKDKRTLTNEVEKEVNEMQPRLNFSHWLFFCGSFTASALIVNLLPAEIEGLLTGLAMSSGVLAGIIFLIRSLQSFFKKRQDIL